MFDELPDKTLRVALVSDIHANLPALEAVAREIEARKIDETWCIGDVVGYGANPREVLEWVEKSTTLTVKGNHDQAVATGDVEGFNPVAASAARYHAQILSPAERTRLHDLPNEARRSLRPSPTPAQRLAARASAGPHGGVPEALIVHGSPADPLREYVYPTTAARALVEWSALADVIIMGHTHVPYVAELAAGERDASSWRIEGFMQRAFTRADPSEEVASPGTQSQRAVLAINPGSVGQPRDGDPRASFAILDAAARTVELVRVDYDIDAAAAAIHKARLDPFLGQRLYRGM